MYCQFHTGEISAQPPCSTRVEQVLVEADPRRRVAPAEGEAALEHVLPVEGRHVDQQHPAVEDRRRPEPEPAELLGPPARRAPLDVVAHRRRADAARCRRRAAPRSRRPARRRRRRDRGAAGSPRRRPPAAPAAGRPPRCAAGPARAPRTPRRCRPGSAEAEAASAGGTGAASAGSRGRCRSRGRGAARAICVGGEGGVAQVVAVAGEDDRGVGARLGVAASRMIAMPPPARVGSRLAAPAGCRGSVVAAGGPAMGRSDPISRISGAAPMRTSRQRPPITSSRTSASPTSAARRSRSPRPRCRA